MFACLWACAHFGHFMSKSVWKMWILGGAAMLLLRSEVVYLTVLNVYPWEASICSLFPLIKAQKWTMQSAAKHEWVLFILRSAQALWKLALEHGSKWKRHHGPNEKLNTLYSSPLVRGLSLLSFEWFWNAFPFRVESLQGWAASLTSFPCLAENESPSGFFLSTLHCKLGFNHVGSPVAFLFTCPSRSFFTAVFCFWCDDSPGLQTAKADWWMYTICGLVCFWANQTLGNCVGREGSLSNEANAVRG